MRSMEFESMDEAYWELYSHAIDNGERFQHRGDVCVELRPFSFTIRKPELGLFTGAPRRMNYRFWAAETLTYLAGWGSLKKEKACRLLKVLNSNYANFSRVGADGVEELNPMVRYGDGFGQGLLRAYDTLSADPGRRQAYVSIWNRDTPHSYDESPCLIGVQYFTSRNKDGQLELCSLANIRSNDMNWGLPYDVASLCAIQLAMAGALGMTAGPYHHVACSLHYYEGRPFSASGCGPPKVSPPDVEESIACPPRMPHMRADEGMTMLDMQRLADTLLELMYTHFVELRRSGKGFSVGRMEEIGWAGDWCDVVRWGWPR